MTAFERPTRPYAVVADPTIAEAVSALDRVAAGLRDELAYIRYERQMHSDLVRQLEQAREQLREHDKAELCLLEIVADLQAQIRSLQVAIDAAGERTGAHHVIDEETGG